jgi:hypothetical protein
MHRNLAHFDKVISFQGPGSVQLGSALYFNQHQGDRDSGILLPSLADARPQPSHKHGKEIVVVRALT